MGKEVVLLSVVFFLFFVPFAHSNCLVTYLDQNNVWTHIAPGTSLPCIAGSYEYCMASSESFNDFWSLHECYIICYFDNGNHIQQVCSADSPSCQQMLLDCDPSIFHPNTWSAEVCENPYTFDSVTYPVDEDADGEVDEVCGFS